MIPLDPQKRVDFLEALRTTAERLDQRLGEPSLDKAATLRLVGQGVGLLLALAIEALAADGGSSPGNSPPSGGPAQLHLFPEA